jgi:hypothetical protein
LLEKALRKVAFADLLPTDHADLVKRNEAARGGLLPALQAYDWFICEAWTHDQLLQTFLVPGLYWAFLRDFIAGKPPVETGPDGRSDPRTVAASISMDQPFVQEEPICVVPYNDGQHCGQLLLEGTLRSILFLRSSDASARILVWVPVASAQ